MIVTNVAYSEFEGKPEAWSLSDFSLGTIDLLLGKNATGKTRIHTVISGLAHVVSGNKRAILDLATYSFKYQEG